MLDRVEVDIIDMGREIVIVADRMFPKAPLPKAALAPPQSCLRAPLTDGQVAGEDRLEHAPSCREIGVALRQRPNAVEMVGKHDAGVNHERSAPTDHTDGMPELIDVPRQQIVAAPLQQIDGEEVTPSMHAMAAVIGNGNRLLYLRKCCACKIIRRVTLRFRPALPRPVNHRKLIETGFAIDSPTKPFLANSRQPAGSGGLRCARWGAILRGATGRGGNAHSKNYDDF